MDLKTFVVAFKNVRLFSALKRSLILASATRSNF